MFRLEIDALNAIYDEQKRTNDLLEKLLQTPKITEVDHKQRGKKNEGTTIDNGGKSKGAIQRKRKPNRNV